MRIHQSFSPSVLAFSFIIAASMHAQASEYAFSTYALGESAFSAGVTPHPAPMSRL